MPTINKRFLFRLLLIVMIITGALIGTHAVQARRIPAALKQQSERAADAGKLDVAIHYLRQYLEFHPTDVDAQVRLAEMVAERGGGGYVQSELLFLYEKILRLDPEREAIRRNALALSLRVGRYNDAAMHAEHLLKSHPNEAALWQQLGSAQAGMNELQAARRSYESAVAHAPDEILGYQRLAQLMWKNLNDSAAARAVLNRMVDALPQEPDAYLTRARFEIYTSAEPGVQAKSSGDNSRARLDLLRVFELDPENAEASLLLSEFMQRNHNITAAHGLLRDAATLYPRNLKLIRSLSWLELIRGNTAAAIAVLEDGLKAIPNGFDLMVPLADLLVQQGDTARTSDILRQLQTRNAPATQVKYLQARITMREQRWDQAIQLIETLRSEIVNLPGLELQLNLLLASCHQKLGDFASEEHAYQRVINADPKNVIARVGLGNLYMNLGRFEDAARELEVAANSPFSTGIVVSHYLKLKSRLLIRSGNSTEWAKLEQVLTTSLPRFGRGSPEPVLLRAEVLTVQARSDEAIRLLRKEAGMRPGDARIWARLALLTADREGTAAGLAVMDEAQATAGDCVDVRLARAQLYAREPGRVRPIDTLSERVDIWPESEQLRFVSGLLEVYDQLGDQENVIRCLRMIVARQPANRAMWLRLHERAGINSETAALARAALVRLEGVNGPSVLLCDARVATNASTQEMLARLINTFGEQPTTADACLAIYQLAKGKNAVMAAGLVERAFCLEPTRYETAAALLNHHASQNNLEGLRRLLTRLSADPRWSGEPFRRVVSLVIVNAPEMAGDLLKICAALLETDLQGPSWLAETAIKCQHPEANRLLNLAVQRSGATSDDWLRKALYESKDNPDTGPTILSEAKSKLSPRAYFSLVAVYADSAAGSTYVPEAATPAEKRMLAEARLAVKFSRSQASDARSLLENFLLESNISSTDADWARRNLAMIYAIGGTPDDRTRAMKLLNSVTMDLTISQEELRATFSALTVLARFLEGNDRRTVLAQTIKVQEAIMKNSGAPADLFTLAQLHQAAGNKRAGRECLQKLLNRNPQELEADPSYVLYLTAALEELVEDGNFEAARGFAGKLLQLRVNDFKSLATIARFEAKAGRAERALAIAEDYARLADTNAGDYMMRSAQVAELLDELARLPNVRGTPAGRSLTDAAVQRFSAVVPTRAEVIVGAVGALAADGRPAEAFEIIERHNRNLPARLRANAGLAIVRNCTVTERQAEVVLLWIDQCLNEDPDSTALLLCKGEYYALRHDHAKAIEVYQRVLKQEPRNVVALNNLAWLYSADKSKAEQALDLVNRATRERGLSGGLLDTRARIHITLKQFASAERDLAEAISYDPSALRWFHVAVLRMNQSPPVPEEAAKAFAEAKNRGLDSRSIHPADYPLFRELESRPDSKK